MSCSVMKYHLDFELHFMDRSHMYVTYCISHFAVQYVREEK